MLERRWLTVKEAGQYLNLSPKTISDFCLRGLIPSIKLGHSRRIDLKALEAKLERQAGQVSGRGGKR